MLCLFDGSGKEFLATLARIERQALHLVISEQLESTPESPLAVHLGTGLSRGERMDWTIQKCTELGVATITPLLLTRCNTRLGQERTGSRMRHWRQVAISACEQSGRTRIPTIEEPVSLEQWLARRSELSGLVLHTSDGGALPAATAPVGGLRILTGPEGGLTSQEFEQALAAGFTPWTLGPRVLRTETAPVAALAILQYIWGDLNAG